MDPRGDYPLILGDTTGATDRLLRRLAYEAASSATDTPTPLVYPYTGNGVASEASYDAMAAMEQATQPAHRRLAHNRGQVGHFEKKLERRRRAKKLARAQRRR